MSKNIPSKNNDPFGGFIADLGDRIERNEALLSGSIQFPRARETWNDRLCAEQMAIPIERLLSEDYYWGKENIWPSVRDELTQIWHLRCDFDTALVRGNTILKRETVYALSYYHAEQVMRERWPRQSSEADRVIIQRDRDLHTVVIETPKGTGKDYEASLIVALLVREYLIQQRSDLKALYNVDLQTTISVNLMNRSEDQAKKVTFSEVIKRVSNDFFLDYFPPQVTLAEIESSGRMPQELKFPKNIVVFPGSGSASTGLGYSLGAEVIDECNFMQQSESSKKSISSGNKKYDAAEEAYDDAFVRHRSRFGTFWNGRPIVAGLIVPISSTRLTTDFTQRMKARAENDPGIYYTSQTFWWRKPLPLSGKTFAYDMVNNRILNPDQADIDYAEVSKPPMADLIAE